MSFYIAPLYLYLLAAIPVIFVIWMLRQASVPISPRIQAIAAYTSSSQVPLLHPVVLVPSELQQRTWHLSPARV
jgi:hypothetical protein